MFRRPPVARRSRQVRAALAASLTAALVLLAQSLTATTPAQAAGPLISQGKPVLASSVEGAGTPAAAAVDGDPGTRWSSTFADPQWIRVDLGATAAIDQVR